MRRSRLVKVVGVVALVAVLMVLAAYAQERQERQIRGTVVSVDLEKVNLTVRAGETGQVLVINAGWKQVEGKWVRNPDQVALIKTLKPGDQIVAAVFFAEEQWIIREIAKVGAEVPRPGGELAQLQQQVTAMQQKLDAMEKKLDTIEGLLRQLLAK